MKKKVTLYYLYKVVRISEDKTQSTLVDSFMDMMEATKVAHELMAKEAVATKIQPRQVLATIQ